MSSLSRLTELKALQIVGLRNQEKINLESAANLDHLRELEIIGGMEVVASSLEQHSFENLTKLILAGDFELTAVSNLLKLEDLSMTVSSEAVDLAHISDLSMLKNLKINVAGPPLDAPEEIPIRNLSVLNELKNLSSVVLPIGVDFDQSIIEKPNLIVSRPRIYEMTGMEFKMLIHDAEQEI